jgi:hypothetical protein
VASVCFPAILFAASASAQFEARSLTPVGNRPLSTIVADFNGDHYPDLAVADGDCVWILLGNGDGTFQTAVSFQTGASAHSVAAADLNHDGNIDLVVADYVGGVIQLLLGNGDGTFQAPLPIAQPLEAPESVVLADVNGDNKMDLVVIDSPFVSVFLNRGKGAFENSQDIELPYVPNGVASGDFDRDGGLDLAVVGFSGSIHEASILLGNGDGTFRSGATYEVGAQPVSVAVADFRGIEKLDLAVADLQGNGIDVLLGNGDGTFQTPIPYPISFPIAVVAADVNGDGWPDLVAAGENVDNQDQLSGVGVLLGNGDGTFQRQRSYPAGSFAWSLAVADLNGDGQQDIALGVDYTHFQVTALLNTGAASFSPTSPLQFRSQLLGTTSSPQTVTLTNSGSASLEISSVKTRSPFMMSTTCVGTLSPGAACQISVSFTPKIRGIVSGTVHIADTASSKPQVIALYGGGTVVSLSPTRLDFPPQTVGTRSTPHTASLTNMGKVGLDIGGIGVEGNDQQDFQEADDCGSHVSAGATCHLWITFSPQRKGPLHAVLSVWDDGGASPQQVSLSGTGK